jgi:hypothetical protein
MTQLEFIHKYRHLIPIDKLAEFVVDLHAVDTEARRDIIRYAREQGLREAERRKENGGK